MTQNLDYDSEDYMREQMQPRRKHENTVVKNQEIAVDDMSNFEEGIYYEGEISVWKRSHGFLKHIDENGDETSLFFHYSNVNTTDKRCLLRKGMQCRFQVEREDGKRPSAVNIESRTPGLPLNFHSKHGPNDQYDRKIQFNDMFFSGTVKFFSRKRCYGRIEPNVEELEEVGAPVEEIGLVYFKEIDIDAADYPIKINRDDEVRFQLFNSSRGWGGMNVQQLNGEPMPQFTEEERAEKRARKAEMKKERRNAKKAKSTANKKKNSPRNEERRPRKEERRQKQKQRRRERRQVEREEVVQRDFEEIDSTERFIGTVDFFTIHRHGFVIPEDLEELKRFGVVKNKKLCFRAHEIQTDRRPAMVDQEAKVSFTISHFGDKKVLYANDIRTVDGGLINAKREYTRPDQKELQSPEIYTGKIVFYNWRRGHGRIQIDGENEEDRYYFHRDDLWSNDKVVGIADGASITCQKVVDPKGLAVTNIMDEARDILSGFGMEQKE